MRTVIALACVVFTFFPLFDLRADEIVCAEVLPCTADGAVLTEFKGSFCEPVYQAQCNRFVQNRLSSDLSACIDDEAEMQARLTALRRQVARLKAARSRGISK